MDFRFAQRVVAMETESSAPPISTEEERTMINFSDGWTPPEYMPADEILAACEEVLTTNKELALQYSPRPGLTVTREMLVEYLQEDYGIEADIENIFVTTGAKQGIDLVCKTMLEPGDKVAVTTPTYHTGLSIFRSHEAEFLEVPIDAEGMDVQKLENEIEELVESGEDVPKLIYDIPESHNPTAATMSNSRREKLIEIAEKYNILIVEDDPYRQLRFDGKPNKPIKAISQSEHVIFLGSFSKLVCPGIRVGWVVANSELLEKFPNFKEDGGTSGLNQLIVRELYQNGYLAERASEYRRKLESNRDAVIESIAEYLPQANVVNTPSGGYYLWVEFPDHVDTGELLRFAKEREVLFLPGEKFYPTDGPGNYIRMAYAYENPDRITEGIKLISTALEDYLDSIRETELT